MPASRPPPPTHTNTAYRGGWLLLQQLHRHRALPCDHVQIVEGVNEDEPLIHFSLSRVQMRIVIRIAGETPLSWA